jgi:hypothetical protein
MIGIGTANLIYSKLEDLRFPRTVAVIIVGYGFEISNENPYSKMIKKDSVKNRKQESKLSKKSCLKVNNSHQSVIFSSKLNIINKDIILFCHYPQPTLKRSAKNRIESTSAMSLAIRSGNSTIRKIILKCIRVIEKLKMKKTVNLFRIATVFILITLIMIG